MTINSDKKAEQMAVCRELGQISGVLSFPGVREVEGRFQGLAPEMRECINLKFCKIAQLPTTTDIPWDQIQNIHCGEVGIGWMMEAISAVAHEAFSDLANGDVDRLFDECYAEQSVLYNLGRVKDCLLKYNKELSESAILKSLEQFFGDKRYFEQSTIVCNLMEAIRILSEGKALTQENVLPLIDHTNPTYLATGIGILHRNGILTEENLLAVRNMNDSLIFRLNIANILVDLKEAGILTPENRQTVCAHHDPKRLVTSLIELEQAGILTPENRQLVCAYIDSCNLALILVRLEKANIPTTDIRERLGTRSDLRDLQLALEKLQRNQNLTQENWELVIVCPELTDTLCTLHLAGIILTSEERESFRLRAHHLTNSKSLMSLNAALSSLKETNILTQENWKLVGTRPELADILCTLHQAQIVPTPEERESLRTHQNPWNLISALNSLRESNILTQENWGAVCGHEESYALSDVLCMLKQARIVLTPDESQSVCTQQNLSYLRSILGHLQWGRILTQGNFEQIMQRPVFCTAEMEYIWNGLPDGMRTQQVFNEMIRLSDEPNPIVRIRTYVNGLIGIRQEAVPGLNDGQSTHTASVHASVSESATRLMNKYDISNLDDIIGALREKINTLPSAPKNDAAKRCLARLTDPFYTFADPTSGVSTRQLLALAYLVNINAKTDFTLFVDGLYEAQREYNLTEDGHDRGGEDSPACTAGTFNKIMEKLVGLDDAVLIIYINPTTASLKLQSAVKDYARQNNITEITEENWPRIREGIREEMAPFREVFRTLEEFEACIEGGQYVELPEAYN